MLNAIRNRLSVPWVDPPAGDRRGSGRYPGCLPVLPTVTFLIALMSGCAGTAELANPPRVSLAGLRLAEIGLVEQRYAARLRIQNPSDARLRVRGMEYTIYINGRKFADGVSDRNFSVAAYSERIVEVILTSTVLRVYEQFKNLSEGEAKAFRYRIAGSLSLSGQPETIPFSYEDVLELSAGAGA